MSVEVFLVWEKVGREVRESGSGVSDLKVSVWLSTFSSVSIGQTRNITPSHEVCIARSLLRYLYY